MASFPLARRMERVTDSAIMGIIKSLAGSAKPPISFASGLPDPQLFPRERLAAVASRVIVEDATSLQYGPTEGLGSLRKLVASILVKRGFTEASYENVIITTGSQQAIDLATRAILDPGDRVAMESPTYLAALQVFSAAEARFVPIKSDLPTQSYNSDPILESQAWVEYPPYVEALEATNPKLAYVTPNYANPTGSSLSIGERRGIRKVCADYNVAILEDDAYHELSYETDGRAPIPISALPAPPNSAPAIYTSTFSKSVSPGLRVGYLYCADTELVRRIAQLKQVTDLHASTLSQRIVEGYLADSGSTEDLEKVRKAYKERKDAMVGALTKHFEKERRNGSVEWTEPQGGMFIFITLREDVDGTGLLKKCWEEGVVFVPGESFYPEFEGEAGGRKGTNTIRLNFVSEGVERIEKGVEILARVLKAELGS